MPGPLMNGLALGGQGSTDGPVPGAACHPLVEGRTAQPPLPSGSGSGVGVAHLLGRHTRSVEGACGKD